MRGAQDEVCLVCLTSKCISSEVGVVFWRNDLLAQKIGQIPDSGFKSYSRLERLEIGVQGHDGFDGQMVGNCQVEILLESVHSCHACYGRLG